jgi:hypothetical protein
MQSVTRQIHRLRYVGFVEPGKNVLHGVEQVGTYSATVSALIKSFKAAVFEAPDHQDVPGL